MIEVVRTPSSRRTYRWDDEKGWGDTRTVASPIGSRSRHSRLSFLARIPLKLVGWGVFLFFLILSVIVGIPQVTYLVLGVGLYSLISRAQWYQHWREDDREPKYVAPTVIILLILHFVVLPYMSLPGHFYVKIYDNLIVNNLTLLLYDFSVRIFFLAINIIPYVLIGVIIVHLFVYLPNMTTLGKIVTCNVLYIPLSILALLWIFLPFWLD